MDKTEYFRLKNSSYGEEDIIFDLSEDTQSSKWAIPWSDLMFILFMTVLVYSLNLYVKKKNVEQAQKERPVKTVFSNNIDNINDKQRSNYKLFIAAKGAASEYEDVKVEFQADRSIKITLSGSLFFDTGRARLKRESINLLKKLSNVIKGSENSVEIVGHTDSVPIHTPKFETNWELSAIRAVKVARYFIEQQGMEPERFTVSGNSMYRPVAPNNISDFKARNRRVDIIIKNEPFL